MMEIILASASPRRSELLRQVGLSKFRVIPADIDESYDGSEPEEFVQKLSRNKALSVSRQLNHRALVIGADTIVVQSGILGKPSSDAEAFEMLKSLQGKWHEVITGVTVVDTQGLNMSVEYERTLVKMRTLSDNRIRAYIGTGEPGDKAGAYGIQGIGALLVEEIKGCYFNVVGLPVMKLSRMLENFGIYLLGQ